MTTNIEDTVAQFRAKHVVVSNGSAETHGAPERLTITPINGGVRFAHVLDDNVGTWRNTSAFDIDPQTAIRLAGELLAIAALGLDR